MKKPVVCMTLLCFLTAGAAVYAGSPVAFSEEPATITVNGAGASGRVFVRNDDPATLLVLVGDAAFLVNRTAQTVHTVAIGDVNEAADPVMIGYGVLSGVEGAGLIVGQDGGVAFLAQGNRYAVVPKGRSYLGPE